jgi:uncharacterized repeat protein (TIGR01451 family)
VYTLISATGGITYAPTLQVDVSGLPADFQATPVFGSNVLQLQVTRAPGTGADLSVTKTDSPDPLQVGSDLTYGIMVTNQGPDAATGVTLTDTLPSGVAVQSVSATQGSCSGSGTITCVLGSLANGASAQVTIVVTPLNTGTIFNTASVTASEGDPNLSNNSAQAQTTVVAPPSADLAVTKSGSPDPVQTGSDLTYDIIVTNLGPDTATNATLTDALPAGAVLQSVSASQGSCSGSGTITCVLGNLAYGDGVQVTIVVTPQNAGTLTNTASVTADQPDPNTANNSAQVQTQVVTDPAFDADLAVVMSVKPSSVKAGSKLTYTIGVSNLGPATATSVILQDVLPAGVVLDRISTARGVSCSVDTIIECSLGTLTSGASTSVKITVKTTEIGTLVNTASVSAAEPDPDTANNTATETAIVR